ncbi:MAG: hypothetical protein K0S65_5338 [Labilithrix sp.]|nr:hypothetical protein [Labilithrix sp.]
MQPASWSRPMPPPYFHPVQTTPPAVYVLASFALMLLLAAAMSVVGSVAALALIDAQPDDEPAETTSSPAASLHR